MLKAHYKKLSKYFIGDCFPIYSSFIFETINNVKIFVLGAIHCFLQDKYFWLIGTAISVEVLTIAVVIFFEAKFQNYKQGFFTGSTLLNLLFMVLLNLAMLIDYVVSQTEMGTEVRDLSDQTIEQIIYFLAFTSILKALCIIGTKRSNIFVPKQSE